MKQNDPGCIYEHDAESTLCPIIREDCVGSNCMAWRWFTPEFEVYKVPGMSRGSRYWQEHERPDGLGPEWTWSKVYNSGGPDGIAMGNWRRPFGDRRYGYCGHFEPKVAEVEISDD